MLTKPVANVMRRRSSWVLAAVFLHASTPAPAASPHPVRAQHAMVASAERLATQVGVDTLRAGGNAVDASCAVGFALAVTFPQAGNLGGGGFSVVRTADGTVYAIDYRETAPLAASRNMYLNADGEADDVLSREGYLAAGVPGTVAGLFELHRKLGKLPFAQLISPALKLARDGFAVPYSLRTSLAEERPLLGRFPESRSLFYRGGEGYGEGELFRQPALAATLEKIQRDGHATFYEGDIAREVVRAVTEGGGVITLEDLKSYKPVWRDPVQFTYRGREIYSMPPPSSGGIILAQVLNMAETQNLASMGFHSSRTIHFMAEAMRRSFRDRAALLGDPDFVRVDTKKLISKEYAAELALTINATLATPSGTVGAMIPEASQTTHYCVVDAQGNAVATTYTLNGSYGCGRMAAGFLLNNEMDDFSAKPGHPNMYGLVGSEANAIEPRKRMLSSMAPTIVVQDGKLQGVLGTPGGSTIPTTVVQLLTNLIDFGLDVQEAVDAPRYHHQYLPDRIKVEKNCIAADGIAALEEMGHKVVIDDDVWGDAQAIWFDKELGIWVGASDSRRWGATAGY